jgi:glycosyltransferase involved in cell wall biosynthesis
MVFVGSVIPRKNVLQLLQAYKDIPQQQKIPLVIVGKGGEYYQKCIDFVSENHLQEYVIFKNNIHSNAVLKLVYQHAILSVYPSVYEGFGLPVVESLLCGTPVITSSVSSMPEAGGNGALYSAPNDLASLTENMQKLLANEDLRKQLVQNGRQHIQQNFNREKLSKQLNTIYQNLLNR